MMTKSTDTDQPVAEQQFVTVDGKKRQVIPCPDGRADCEVLHLAPEPSPTEPVARTCVVERCEFTDHYVDWCVTHRQAAALCANNVFPTPEAGEPLTAGPRSKINDAELFVVEERSNTRGNWLPLPDAYTTQDEGLKVLERKLKAGGFRYKRLMVYQAREEVKTLQCSNCGRVQMFSSSAIASWIIAENGGVLCPNHK